MERRGIGRALRASAVVLAALLLSTLPTTPARAGTTGKLAGRVLDKDKQPLAGANVVIPLARLGAATDAEGRYVIQNIPAGSWDVKFSLIGYGAVTMQNVRVTPDQTTRLDQTLQESALQMQEIVVSARRPVVDLNLTSTLASVSREEIKNLPVQELQDVVNLQAGVVDGHFRGGRLGEVQYQVDGVSVNNAYDNSSSLRLDRSLLQEVQVISGTFDAEYGQAMSGVVNAVLRRGTEQFRWDAEAMTGGFVYPGDQNRIVSPVFKPIGVQNYQLTVSGPTGLPKTYFLANGRYYHFDDWVYGENRFAPTDSSDFANKVFRPTGDDRQVPLGTTREWSGLVKLTNQSLRNIDLNYQAVFDRLASRRMANAFRLDPDGRTKQRTASLVHGLDVTHTLSKSTYYSLSLRQNYFDYRDMAFDDVYDPRYDAAGPPVGDASFETGAFVQGVDFGRFTQNTNAMVLKGSFVSQINQGQQLKFGGEYQWPNIEFGHPGYLAFTTVGGVNQLVRHVDDPPNFPGVQTYRPRQAAYFAQDDIEWNDLKIRAGLRAEYFNARAGLPSDLANPANSIDGAPVSLFHPASRKLRVSPRVGVSYPITKDAALFFAYGHFLQMPALGQLFTNADYSILADLQAGGISYGVMGNPDVRPEKTVQYQFGYKQALTDWLGLDLNIFYKDIRDLLGTEFIETYNGAEYARLTNVDFGNVIGYTVTLDQRQRGLLSTTLDYTWQIAQGNASDPRETATRAAAGEDPRPRQVYFNWDQRHTLNLTVVLSKPEVFSVSGILRGVSGQPYTPTIATGFGGGLEPNSGRRPKGLVLDLRAEHYLRLGGLDLSTFGRVFNAFDTRFFNGFVFGSTGSPNYSLDPAGDRTTLNDPTRFYAPRRIEIGVTMRSPQK